MTHPLTPHQRRLAHENLGLVAVHIHRFGRHGRAAFGEEWDELFQEGCVGLFQAAARWKPRDGIPFAAFAIPRIRNAIGQALRKRTRAAKRLQHGHRGRAQGERRDGLLERLPAKQAEVGDQTEFALGDALRDVYTRAVRAAAAEALSVTRGQKRMGGIVRLLVNSRFLVPEPSARLPLRQIARQARVTYGRVAGMNHRLLAATREFLDADAVFRELCTWQQSWSMGCDTPLEDMHDVQLAGVGATEFIGRLRRSGGPQRGRMLARLFRLDPGSLHFVRERFVRLPRSQRLALMVSSRAG